MTEPERQQQWSRVGPYRIERRLGTGGMGVVYLAHHDPTGIPAAVKLLRPEYLADPRLRARLRRELQAARRVPRSCTATVLDADLDADPPWVATEYIDGPTLEVALLEHGRLAGPALESFAAGVAVALRAIHVHGVIHRDLKPTNVLLSPVGPRVIDFGIARIEPGQGTQPTQLTQPGTVVGTPAYMAPEQLRGEPVTAAVDVFAWGGLVAYAATGRPPFGTGRAVLHEIVFGEPDLGDLDEPLRSLVTAALDKDPKRRPTAGQLVERLSEQASGATTRVLADAATDASTVTLAAAGRGGDRAGRIARVLGGRRWRPAALAAAAVSTLVVASATVAWLLPGEPPPLADRSITIGVFHGWPEGIAATFLWKLALEEQGAQVTLSYADVEEVYQRVAGGDYDVAFDAWLPATHQQYWADHGDDLEDLGPWCTGAALTIAVNDDAPIRSLAELAGAAEQFDDRLVGIEPGAGLTQVTRGRVIPTYGLEGMRFEVSSTERMLQELSGALARGDNIAVTLWEPHWLYDEFPIRNLADPENVLGVPDRIHSFARSGFSDDFPQVASWIGDFQMSADDLRSLENVMFNKHAAVSSRGYEEAVRDWLSGNPGYLAGLTGGGTAGE